jgi:hypothetical protein
MFPRQISVNNPRPSHMSTPLLSNRIFASYMINIYLQHSHASVSGLQMRIFQKIFLKIRNDSLVFLNNIICPPYFTFYTSGKLGEEL